MNTQLTKIDREVRFLSYYPEKIEIAKILLAKSSGDLCAVVSGFRCADKILAGWVDPTRNLFECQFKIEFLDGLVIRGQYSLAISTRRRPSLYRFLCERLKGVKLTEKIPDAHHCSSLCEDEIDFLSKYSLECV